MSFEPLYPSEMVQNMRVRLLDQLPGGPLTVEGPDVTLQVRDDPCSRVRPTYRKAVFFLEVFSTMVVPEAAPAEVLRREGETALNLITNTLYKDHMAALKDLERLCLETGAPPKVYSKVAQMLMGLGMTPARRNV